MELEGALLGPGGFLVAIVVGTVSFFSPCILPLLPGYLGYVSGLGGEQTGVRSRHRVIVGTLLFICGFALVFTALGATASAIGELLVRNISILSRIAGGVVILMGLAFMLPQLVPALERERRPFLRKASPGIAGAFPLGMAFAVGWTPCVGPGLGVMLTLAANEGSVLRGSVLLLAFSVGFGIWFLLASLGAERLLRSGWLKRRVRAIQLVGGLAMVAIGVLLVSDLWYQVMAPLIRWSNEFSPAL